MYILSKDEERSVSNIDISENKLIKMKGKKKRKRAISINLSWTHCLDFYSSLTLMHQQRNGWPVQRMWIDKCSRNSTLQIQIEQISSVGVRDVFVN